MGKNYSDMTDDQLRVEVAKALGFCFDDDYGSDDRNRRAVHRGGVHFGYRQADSPITPGQLDAWQIPDWPRSISAAWELVEKMASMDKFYGPYIERLGSCWEVSLSDIHDGDFAVLVQNKSAPRAICIAFLKSREAANA